MKITALYSFFSPVSYSFLPPWKMRFSFIQNCSRGRTVEAEAVVARKAASLGGTRTFVIFQSECKCCGAYIL